MCFPSRSQSCHQPLLWNIRELHSLPCYCILSKKWFQQKIVNNVHAHMQIQKASNTPFWDFSQVNIFALLNFRASRSIHKPQRGFQTIQPAPGSCDRPRKTTVFPHLLRVLEKPLLWKACFSSVVFPQRSEGIPKVILVICNCCGF